MTFKSIIILSCFIANMEQDIFLDMFFALVWLCFETRPLLLERRISVLISCIPVYRLMFWSYAVLRPIFQFRVLFLHSLFGCVRLVAHRVIFLAVLP